MSAADLICIPSCLAQLAASGAAMLEVVATGDDYIAIHISARGKPEQVAVLNDSGVYETVDGVPLEINELSDLTDYLGTDEWRDALSEMPPEDRLLSSGSGIWFAPQVFVPVLEQGLRSHILDTTEGYYSLYTGTERVTVQCLPSENNVAVRVVSPIPGQGTLFHTPSDLATWAQTHLAAGEFLDKIKPLTVGYAPEVKG